MIPKIIHYCWMSGKPYPEKIRNCINSWKQILPEYEILLWDSNRFDVNNTQWTREAMQEKKYAFVADYIRCYALYNYGGIYLDSDVEVKKTYNDLLDLPYFIGYESTGYFEAATMGTEKYNPLFGALLDYYNHKTFIKEDGTADTIIMPKVMMSIANSSYTLKKIDDKQNFDYSNGILSVFSYDFFSPIDTTGKRYILRNTKNTYSIHHFVSAWVDWKVMLLFKILGNRPIRLKLHKIFTLTRDRIKRFLKLFH